ncbi:hypothetical protein SLS58_009045 [Diplodia intermedia]|uniref:Rhodopsin domain-containing protein n=1 Tax=Diplodia intermedia TaxID=856260 RepID=A0ABR3TFC7_9PEZI
MTPTTEGSAVWGVYGTGKPMYNFNIASLIVLWFMFGLRGYVRVSMVKVWSATDWHMMVTMGLYTWLCVSVNISIYDGFGRDMNTLSPDQLKSAFKQYYFAEFTYVASVLFIKLSLAYFYLPLTNLRWQIHTVYAIIAANSLYTTGYLCIILFQCRPVAHFWNQFAGAAGGGRCLSSTVIMNLSYAHNSMEIISDWIISALPIWLLAQTQLTRRTKLGVGLLLSLGAFASIASIIRITQLTSFSSSTNYTVTSVPIILWSVVESAAGIFAANLATLRVLLTRVLARLGLSSHGASSAGHSGGGGPSSKTPRNRRRGAGRASFAIRGAATATDGYCGREGHDLARREGDQGERVGSDCGGSFKSTERMVVQVVEGGRRRPGDAAGAGGSPATAAGGFAGQQYHATVVSRQGGLYDDEDGDDGDVGGGAGVALKGISKKTEITVTSEQRG